jgi:hypothetical protein
MGACVAYSHAGQCPSPAENRINQPSILKLLPKKASIQTIPSFGKSNKRGAKSKSDLESLVGDVHVCQVLQQAHHLVQRL